MPYKVRPCHRRLSSAAGAALCACAALAAISNAPNPKPVLSTLKPRWSRLPALHTSEVNFKSLTALPPTVVIVGFNRRIVTVILRALPGAHLRRFTYIYHMLRLRFSRHVAFI